MSSTTSLNLNDDDRHLLQDQKMSALWNVSFWSHPAWSDSGPDSLSTSATRQLAIHHRINAALHKETVAEMICGVKCVIPNSRLAKYGDFRYDIDYEDMYCDLKDVKEEKQLDEVCSKVSDRLQNQSSLKSSSCFESDTTLRGHDNILPKYREEELQFDSEKFLGQWLNEVQTVLEDTRRIATDSQALDSRTEGHIKLCLRFIHIAKGNNSLVKIMDSDVPFIIDFNQLRREPVSKMELLSLPQPEFEGDSQLDLKALDDLWLRLASAQIRRLWTKGNPLTQSVAEEATRNQKYSLAKVNFLRRFRQSNQPDSDTERLVIPRETEVELLGSLLHDIEETPEEPSPVHRDAEGVKGGYFANQLSSNFSFNASNENTAMTVAQRMVFGSSAVDKKKTHSFPPKTEHLVPPGLTTLPLRFYKSTPPPTLGSDLNVHQSVVRQPCMYWQTMNGTPLLSQNCYHVSQQIQESTSSTSKTNNPPPGFIQTPVRLSTRNYSCPQRPNTPVQLTPQYSRIHPRINNSDSVSEILRRQSLNERLHIDAKNILRRNEEILNTNRMDKMQENEHIRHLNDSALVTNKVPQVPKNYETRLPFAAYQSHVNLTRNCSNFPPLIPEKCSNYQAAANMYIHENEHVRPLLDSVGSTKKLPMLPSSFETRASLTDHQKEINATRSSNFFQLAVSEKCGYQTANIYSKQLNYPPQKRESRIPHRTSNPGINYSLPPPGIHNMFLSRMPVPGLISQKAKFLGGITVNNLRQFQEKFYSQKTAYSEMEDSQKNDKPGVTLPLSIEENSVGYEDKVTKWLETVNQNMELASYFKSESSYQTSSNCHKLASIHNEETYPSNNCDDAGRARITKAHFHSTKDNVSHKQTTGDLKCRKNNVKKLLLMHLHIFDKSLKLKKGQDLEGKIKLIKRYFTEISLKGKNGKTFLTPNTENAKIRKRFHGTKKEKTSDKQVMSEESNLSSFEMDFESPYLLKHNAENWRKFAKSLDEFKILYRENIHFNGFPSKRSKLKLFDEECWTYNDLAWKISCMNYFDMLTNDLFFSKKNELDKKNGFVAETAHRIDGWTHFKIVVKTIVRNILKALKNRESREKKVIK